MILGQYWPAYEIYPALFFFGGGALLAGYLTVMTVLMRRSLRVRPEATAPGFFFSIWWLALFIEGELAFILILAALTLVGVHETPLTAVILAAVPILYAAVKGFSRQPWGGPFAATLQPVSLRMLGWAALALVVLEVADAGFMQLMTLVTHHPAPAQETVPFIQFAWHTNPVTAFLAVVLVAPVTEEVIFRGLIFGAVEGRLGRWGAIGVSALVFAAAHFQVLYFVPLLICGVALGWLRAKSGSLAPSMLVHCVNNGISLAGIMLFDKAS